MAQITKRKNGSYLIRVSCGYRADGKQVTQSTTWKPAKANMTENAIQKAVQKFALEFEQKCRNETVVNTTKFEEFAEKWMCEYAERKLKKSTVIDYKKKLPRIYEKIGHLRLDKISKGVMQDFVMWLEKQSLAKSDKAHCYKSNFTDYMKEKGFNQKMLAEKAKVSCDVVRSLQRGENILYCNAEKIASALEINTSVLFEKIKTEKKLSEKSVKNYICLCSSIFDYAVSFDYISKNPCNNLILRTVPKIQQKMFTLDETRKFLGILENSELKYQCFFNLAIYGGFRKGELLALEWGDVNTQTGTISINKTSHINKGVHFDDKPKTAAGNRIVKIPIQIMQLLQKWKVEQMTEAFRLGGDWHKTNKVFTSWNGLQMGDTTPNHWLQRVCKENNLPEVNVHSFRHLNASLLIASGANVKTVQALLGHSDSSTTLDIYAESFAKYEAEASEALANILLKKA